MHPVDQKTEQMVRSVFIELNEPGNHPNVVTAIGKGFHQQPIGFVAAAVCGKVQRIVGQQDPHGSGFAPFLQTLEK